MNNKLIEQIQYKENKFYKQLSYLHNSSKKIGMFGLGIYAGFLEQRLKKWGIDIDFYVIDDTYFDPKKDYRKIVIPLSELTKYNDAILIIGFETIVEKEEFLKSKISEIYRNNPSVEVLDFEHCYVDWDFITYPYILDHIGPLQATYDLLEDSYSKRVMVEYLNTCVSGASKDLCLLKTDHKHDYEYDLAFCNKSSGAILECGAFTGKTAIELNEYINNIDYSGKIISLEPDKHNYDALCNKTQNVDRVIPLMYGVSEENGKLFFDTSGGQGSKIVCPKSGEEGKYESIDIINIDSLAEKYGEIWVILMDVEGSELAALKGGKEAIKKYKPALGIRVYHQKEDIFTIPMYIKEEFRQCNYKLYFRINANSRGILDMTLYAI